MDIDRSMVSASILDTGVEDTDVPVKIILK